MTDILKLSNQVIILLLGLVLIVPAVGEEAAPQYKVEMILFTPRYQPAEQSIQGSDQAEWPDLENTVELSETPSDGGFRALPTSETSLAKEALLIAQSGRYDVVKHLIWEQPGLDQASAKAVHIHGGKDYRDEFPERLQVIWSLDENDQLVQTIPEVDLEQLDGTVSVVLGRFLHINTDLIFRHPVADPTPHQGEQVPSAPHLVDFRIRLHRRMRSGELHYLDHPLLGILVEITPVQQPESNLNTSQ